MMAVHEARDLGVIRRAADLISLTDTLEDVVRKIAQRKGGETGDVTVIMLDRPRHEQAVEALREVGASIRFISDGDVAASLFAVMPNTGIDLLWGVVVGGSNYSQQHGPTCTPVSPPRCSGCTTRSSGRSCGTTRP